MSQPTLRALAIAGLLSFAGIAQAAIPAGERTVLLNRYNSTGGPAWTNNANWTGAAGTECTWFGVVCNAGGTSVRKISLSGNNLAGSLPSINGLTNLASLYFNSNQLTWSIPALTGLTKLTRLWVDGNQLTGNVPSVPVPSALLAGQSFLCPNFLNHKTDVAWDVPTGVTPWYSGCLSAPFPAVQSRASRKVHGTAGTFDLPLAP